jgi:nucleoside-diphosphate-sugar epimerase
MSRVLVAGATGVIGREAVREFRRQGWDVVAVSRRAPDVAGVTHIPVDLRDPVACRTALAGLSGVTHLVYAALYEKPGLIAGWLDPEQMATNEAMLANLLAGLDLTHLEHASLLQGAKAYGGHVHPIPVPARAEAPRDPHENFYWLQEDLLASVAAERGFATTILRPQLLVGGTVGSAMNIPPVIGVYAAICREIGHPFSFPGGAPFVWEAVDARLCGEALVWASQSPTARDRTFNITNGDVFTWRDLWPGIAAALGVEPAEDEPMALAEFIPAHEDVWNRVCERDALLGPPLRDLLGESHHYADFCFNYGNDEPWPPIFLSTVSLRKAGFGGCYDTQESFAYWLDDLTERRILPQRPA